MKKVLVTGGAGFIGSHFVDLILDKSDHNVIVIDNLTYAGKQINMSSFIKNNRVKFIKLDISDKESIQRMFESENIDFVVNFAAESHVDNSIKDSSKFITTNIIGVHNLIDMAMLYWTREEDWTKSKRFLQISTDEVYGSLEDNSGFSEGDPLRPNNPYSASKASADLIVMSYFKTFGFPAIITRSSNNFGPRQDIEKFIPKIIYNSINNIEIPIYGSGENVRDWIFVRDNCYAIYEIMMKGKIGEVYNIGGDNELKNIDVAAKIIELVGPYSELIVHVEDRLGHDFRYSIDSSKTFELIGEYKEKDFDTNLNETIQYYKI